MRDGEDTCIAILKGFTPNLRWPASFWRIEPSCCGLSAPGTKVAVGLGTTVLSKASMMMDLQAQISLAEGVSSVLSELAFDASLELTPHEVGRVQSVAALLPIHTRLYLTNIRGIESSVLIQAAARVRSAGLSPVAHIAARRLHTLDDLRTTAMRLADTGCDQLLLIAGDDPAPAGRFSGSVDVLETGVLERAGFKNIAIGGHPEGSPDIPNTLLWEALRRKNDYARSSAARFRLVTQFCFDAEAVLVWERMARERGNAIPIHVGTPGPTTIAKLIKFATMCGVGASLGFLRRQARNALQLTTRWRPDAFVAAVAQGKHKDPACLIQQLHFYPFGAVNETVAYMNSIKPQRGASAARGRNGETQ